MKIVEQEQYAQRHHDRGPHDVAQLAAIAGAGSLFVAKQTPAPGEPPAAESDQDDGPEAVDAKLKQPHGMQQEQKSKSDQNHSTGWNAAAVNRGSLCCSD